MDKSKDFKTFGLLIAFLDETFARESSSQRVDIYFEVLKDLEIGDIEKAIYSAIGTLKFYPVPAILRELIIGSSEDRAELAWKSVIENVSYYYSFDFEDPLIAEVILTLWNTWEKFCEELTVDNATFFAKDFKALYKSLARTGQRFEKKRLYGFYGGEPIEIPAAYKIQPALENKEIPIIIESEVKKITDKSE